MIDDKNSSAIENAIKYGTVVGLGCTESAYLYHTVSSITSFEDPDLPALLLFLQYLTQLEGSLWRQIRGQGLAYSYDAVPRPNEGLLYFTLYRCSNVVAAFKEAQSIIVRQQYFLINQLINFVAIISFFFFRKVKLNRMPFGMKHYWNQPKVH